MCPGLRAVVRVRIPAISCTARGEGVARIMAMRRLLLVLALAACTPSPARAVTLAEVVTLSKGGVSEQVILALIERDQALFSLSPDQLVKLQREGVSDTILL